MQISMSFALLSWLPVILSAFALGWLTRMIRLMDRESGDVALVGTGFVVLGGGLAAGDTFLIARGGTGMPWMRSSLFVLLAPGFICMAYALWSGQRTLRGQWRPASAWPIPALLVTAVIGSIAFVAATIAGKLWFFVLLTITTGASFTVSTLCAKQAWQQGQRRVGQLFVAYIVSTILLNAMVYSAMQPSTAGWIIQFLNIASTALLAIGAHYLNRKTHQQIARIHL